MKIRRGDIDGSDNEEANDIFSSTSGVLKKKDTGKIVLKRGQLPSERLRYANQAEPGRAGLRQWGSESFGFPP
jgi:U3 small nucleolar RNA-associated protein 18